MDLPDAISRRLLCCNVAEGTLIIIGKTRGHLSFGASRYGIFLGSHTAMVGDLMTLVCCINGNGSLYVEIR